ncbi:MAG: hypothetical protein LBG52_03195, partial [Candidatus Peribacteria bacterium]|nr:hypothetical protein [Candidatus Peribacteria bacterium]
MNTWLFHSTTFFPMTTATNLIPIFDQVEEKETVLSGEVIEMLSPNTSRTTYNGLPIFTASDLQRPY